MLVRRIMATFVDIFVFVVIVVFTFVFALPFFFPTYEYEMGIVVGIFVLICIFSLVFLLQLPFMLVNQTIGKGLLGLRIVSTNPGRPLTVGIIFQRELFAKAMTCYFMCVPVFFGKQGQHDIACETEVV